MKTIERRRLLGANSVRRRGCGAGLALTSAPIEAMPFDARVAGSLDEMIEKAQVVVVNSRRPPPRHHRHRHNRRWRCWWHRGRRVCGWR